MRASSLRLASVLRTALAAAALVALVAAAGPAARGEGAEGDARATAHRIEIRFDPSSHAFAARDVVTVDTSTGRRLRFALEATPAASVGGVALDVTRDDAQRHVATLPAGTTEVAIEYRGTMFDAVRKSDDLAWVVGDRTKGIVSAQGIYLSEESGWYPRFDGLARFDVVSHVPAPFLVVTQGGVPERSVRRAPRACPEGGPVAPPAAPEGTGADAVDWNVSVARAALPTDGCSLSAGPYRVASRRVGAVEVSTYFFEGEAADAPLWLDATAEVVERYARILGPYPHPKFDVVENFFSSGYGMPSYTLLGDEVVRYVTAGAKRAGGKIPPGYLDHEYVHGWFGNGLFVDPSDGNWCEALTTYFSNYLAKELESPDAARAHRRGVLEKFAIRVHGEADYPVRAFRSKTEDADDDVGYGKGSLVFHALRRRLGDDAFFAAVRRTAAARVGTFVSWTDWLAALDGGWATPYLERPGLPSVRLASATAWPAAGGGFEVRAEVVADLPRGEAPWPATDVPVAVDGVPAGTVRLDGRSAVWRARRDTAPKTVEIDAGHDLLRAIAPEDVPPCLTRTLAAEHGEVAAEGSEAVETLAARLVEKGHVRVSADAPESERARVTLRVRAPGEAIDVEVAPGAHVVIGDGERGPEIRVGGTTYAGPEHAVLFSTVRDGVPRTWFVALSTQAAARAERLPHYGWDPYVVFASGRPVGRGSLGDGPHATRREVVRDDEAAARVAADVERLASDAFGGRRPGTPGHEATRAFLRERTTALLGAAPEAHAFGLGVADLVSSRDLVVTTDAGTEVIRDAFRPLFTSGERARGAPLPFAEGVGSVPAPGKVADPSPEGLARYHAMILSGGSAPAILVAPTDATREALAPLLDAPNALTPQAERDLSRPGRDGAPRARPPLREWIHARRLRALHRAAYLDRPILFLEEHAVARLEGAPTVRTIDFEVRFGPERAAEADGTGGENLLATWGAGPHRGTEGATDEKRPPAVLVSAHYDSFGLDGGRMHRGADDNATGVACVLEALRGLPEAVAAAGGAKRALVVAFFDGEEWGLAGSRAAAEDLVDRFDLEAMVNVDSVGRVRGDEVSIVGVSTHADLAARLRAPLATAGLAVGRDVDRFAYAEGSDHWPFHEHGVPAVTLWASAYETMNTPDDVPEVVDPVGVARLAAALRAALVELLTR